MHHYRIVRFQRRTVIEMLGGEEPLTQEERLEKHRELETIFPLAEAEMRRLATVRSPALTEPPDSCYVYNRWAGWYGVEANEPVPVSECTRRGDWTTIRIGAYCCRVRTEDVTVEDYGSFRAKSDQALFVPIPLANGTLADTLLDPTQSFFRRPDEAFFWELITADSLRASARRVYAKRLEAHDDPHAWVFREPAPFAVGSVRFDWTEAMVRVNCGTTERRPMVWEFARITGRGAAVPFTLSDGSPLPQFIAYLLGVTRIRADQRLSETDRHLLDGPVRALGLSLMADLLFNRYGDLICRITDPRSTIDYLSQVMGRSPRPMTELAIHLREVNRPPSNEVKDERLGYRCVQFCRPTLLELAPIEEFIPREPPSVEETAGWNRREWWGIESDETLFVDGWFADGDWTILDIVLCAGCRVRTADLVFGKFNEERTGRELFVRLEDGPVAATLLDPVRSFFRRPEEAGFWERIAADWCDVTARLVYADWLDDHGDPHAWVFREPTPFTHGYLRFDWIGAASQVGHTLSGRQRTLWEFAGLTRRERGVWFPLADGTPVPPFVAYLLGVTRIRAEERLPAQLREVNGAEGVVQAARVEYPFLPGIPGPVLCPNADLDPLTGVGNRGAFDTVLAEAVRQRTTRPFPLSALSLDLDHFGVVNHTHSHTAADRALFGFAGLVRSTLGDRGFVARTTGDGFTILLPNAGAELAFEIGEELRRAVERWRGVEGWGGAITLTVSVGVAEFTTGQSDNLRDVAEDAVHRAKAAGRNRVSF